MLTVTFSKIHLHRVLTVVYFMWEWNRLINGFEPFWSQCT